MNRTLEMIWSYICFALILIGIGGVAIRLFSPNGWGERLIGVVWEAEVRSPLIATPIVLGTVYLVYRFLHGNFKPATTNRIGNLIFYGMALAGAYFLWLWILA